MPCMRTWKHGRWCARSPQMSSTSRARRDVSSLQGRASAIPAPASPSSWQSPAATRHVSVSCVCPGNPLSFAGQDACQTTLPTVWFCNIMGNAVQFRGGGVVHGPVVRSHAFKLNKKIRRLGLMSALSVSPPWPHHPLAPLLLNKPSAILWRSAPTTVVWGWCGSCQASKGGGDQHTSAIKHVYTSHMLQMLCRQRPGRGA